MNHKQKLNLARKLRTPAEESKKVPVFQTRAWYDRSKAIEKRLLKKIK